MVQKYTTAQAFDMPEEFVENCLGVYRQYWQYVQEPFESHALMRIALDQACSTFINCNPHFPQLLSNYSDCVMNTSSRSSPQASSRASSHPSKTKKTITRRCFRSDVENEQKLSNIAKAFSLLQDKDVFTSFYAQALARRLICDTSVADEYERSMLEKMCDLCGTEFVSKMQRMLTDNDMSKSTSVTFSKWMTDQQVTTHAVSFQLKVLTAGSWPMAMPSSTLVLPNELEHCVHMFTTFYQSQSTGRRLHWDHSLSSGSIKASGFGKRAYEIQANTHQLAILMMYNNYDVLTLAQIAEMANVTRDVVRQHIVGLVLAKVLLEHKTSEGESTAFHINLDFHHRKNRVHIPQVQKIQSMPKDQEVPTVSSEVLEDRSMAIQAAVVRIMKSRRELSHSMLMTQVVQMLKDTFLPNVAMIKKSIELLIEKEYIQRKSECSSDYTYVA